MTFAKLKILFLNPTYFPRFPEFDCDFYSPAFESLISVAKLIFQNFWRKKTNKILHYISERILRISIIHSKLSEVPMSRSKHWTVSNVFLKIPTSRLHYGHRQICIRYLCIKNSPKIIPLIPINKYNCEKQRKTH